MLEFTLVQESELVFITSFFDGHYRLEWPADIFDHFVTIGHNKVPVASHTALTYYRQKHAAIEHSYRTWLQIHET